MKKENHISYEDYLELVKQEIADRTGQRVELHQVSKNNGIVLDAIVIISKESNISPTIYLNAYYQKFITDGIDVVAERIMELYEQSKTELSFDVSMLLNFDKVKHRIKMKLINYEKNKALLENTPHKRILDLAVVFMIVLETDDVCEFGTIRIHKGFLNAWDITEDSLYQIAKENMANDFTTTPLDNIIHAVLEHEQTELLEEKVYLYVLTTQSKIHGAIGMLQTGLLDAFMKKYEIEKLIILPSSVHEVLLVPYEKIDTDINLHEMVQEVNATQLTEDEFLSNNIYSYDGKELKIFE